MLIVFLNKFKDVKEARKITVLFILFSTDIVGSLYCKICSKTYRVLLKSKIHCVAHGKSLLSNN